VFKDILMTSFAIGGMLVAMAAVLTVLGLGLFTMVRGKDISGQTSNKLMWWRVMLQGIALAFFAIVLILKKKSG
jgi:hypothetical protein